MTGDTPIRVHAIYGHVEIDSGFRADPSNPDRLIAWGLSRWYDEHGNLTREQYDENGSIENVEPSFIEPKEPPLTGSEKNRVRTCQPKTWRDEIRRHAPALKAAGLFCLLSYAGLITLAWWAK